ncbi:MAG: metallophosphoesterase, partial [Firmicutes bacterium]|nr:metallophosphoesterase [Bacillota bacterium]
KLVICGTRGWFVGSSEQDKKIYHREVERLKLSLQSLKKQASPNDIILAMSHYPPYGAQVSKTPFTDLYTEYGIQTVVYGHLHGTHNRTPQKVQIDNTQYILTSCDLVGHKLVEIF